MLEMNKVMLIGNLTRDPEEHTTQSGKTVASFTLAVNRGFGENKTVAYIDCKAWEKRAEYAMANLAKGKRIYVEGDLRQECWEQQDGKKRSKLVVNAYRIAYALPKALEPNAAAEERGGMADNDAPFPDPQAKADPTPPHSQGDMFPAQPLGDGTQEFADLPPGHPGTFGEGDVYHNRKPDWGSDDLPF